MAKINAKSRSCLKADKLERVALIVILLPVQNLVICTWHAFQMKSNGSLFGKIFKSCFTSQTLKTLPKYWINTIPMEFVVPGFC